MSGMGSTLQLNNPTVVVAFRSALIHQGIIALLIFFLLAMLWVSVREWVPGSRTSFGPLAGGLPAEPRGRRLIRIGFGVLWILDGLLQAQPARARSVPDGGVTLAAAPGGFEALTARGGQLSVWALSSGSSAWSRSQVINVAIPYGSSG